MRGVSSLRNLTIFRAAFLMVPLSVFGCGGGGDFGEHVQVVPQKRTRLSASLPVRLPGADGFNVADYQQSSQGGSSSEASADSSGRAMGLAVASADGASSAEFQLGQVLTHSMTKPTDAIITFHVDYECVVSHPAPHLDQSPLSLKAYVMDSARKMHGKIILTEADTSRLPERWRGSQSPSFRVRLEPDLAYHLIVAGRVEATAGESEKSGDSGDSGGSGEIGGSDETGEAAGESVSIEIKSLVIDIESAKD